MLFCCVASVDQILKFRIQFVRFNYYNAYNFSMLSQGYQGL